MLFAECNYKLPDIHVINALNIEQECNNIIDKLKTCSFVCIHTQSTDAVQLCLDPKSPDQFYDHYCLLRRAINQSGLVSVAMSIGLVDNESNVANIVHYQIALCPLTDHNEHPHFIEHMLTKGYDAKESPFAIRYFPGKPKSNSTQIGGMQQYFKYPDAHTAFIRIMNSLLRPPPSRIIFVYDGLKTLMEIYRHFHTDLPRSTHEFLVDIHDMYGKSIVDLAEYAKISKLPLILPVLATCYGTSTTPVSLPFIQQWQSTTDAYERQIVQSKIKLISGIARGSVCEKYQDNGYCALEGACAFSHCLEDVLATEQNQENIMERKNSLGKTWKVPIRFRTWHLEGIWMSCLVKNAAIAMFGKHMNKFFAFGNYEILAGPITNVMKSENHELRMNALYGEPVTQRPTAVRGRGRGVRGNRGGRGRGRGNTRGRGGRGCGRY